MRNPVLGLLLFTFLTCVFSHVEKSYNDDISNFLEDELKKAIYEKENEGYVNDDDNDEELIDLKDDDDDDDDDDDMEATNDKKELAEEELIQQLIENNEVEPKSSDEVELESDEIQDILKLERKPQRDPWRRWKPRIRVPRVRVRLPRIRIRVPRVRLPRVRLPRIRLRRIRLRRLRIRLPRLRRLCTKAKLCKPKPPNCPSEAHITNSMNAMTCPSTWKSFFKPEYQYLVGEFKGLCTLHHVCGSCAGVAPWSRAVCENNLSKQLHGFCASMTSEQDNAEDRAYVSKWCTEKVNKMLGDARSRSYARLSYCQCLPDDFNSD